MNLLFGDEKGYTKLNGRKDYNVRLIVESFTVSAAIIQYDYQAAFRELSSYIGLHGIPKNDNKRKIELVEPGL
jgi:hypothetical protein